LEVRKTSASPVVINVTDSYATAIIKISEKKALSLLPIFYIVLKIDACILPGAGKGSCSSF
jgi:hypothetical protein